MILLPWLLLALIATALWLPPVPAGLAITAAGSLLVVTGCNGRWPTVAICLLPVMVVALTLQWRLDDRLAAKLHGQDVVLDGWVCDFPRHNGRATRFLFVPDPASKPAGIPARIRVAWYEPAVVVAAGSHWRLKLRLRQIRGLSNPGGFDMPRQALLSGVGARAYVRPSKLNRLDDAGSPVCPLIGWRAPIAAAVEQSLQTSSVAGYLLALTVGVRYRLAPGDWEVLRRTGTAHLMAISGLHIGLLAGLGLWSGRRLARVLAGLPWISRPAMAGPLFALIAAAGYAALAGFSIPTSRALIMVAVGVSANLLSRTVGAWRTLSAALFGVLLFEPLAPLSMGFWMSFAAVACLLSGSTAVVQSAPTARMRLLTTQFRITLGLAPLAALLFGQFSLVSPLANLLAVPIVGLIVVPLALAGAVTAWLGLADWPLRVAAAILEMLLALLSSLGELPFAALDVLPRAGWAWLLAAVAVSAGLWPVPFPARWVALWLFGPVLLGAPPVSVPARLRVTVADVGQGLAVVVQTRHHALLYDTGPAYDNGDAGRSVVVPMLRHLGLAELDRIVVSHSDTDHSGGLGSVLQRYPGTLVVTSGAADLGLADALPCHAGQKWSRDGVQFEILYPPMERGTRLRSDNDRSCVLLVHTATASVLLTGDISRRAERELRRQLAARWPGPVDVLLVPHHGSATSSGAGFIAATRPRFAVISAGFRNRWGFPKPAVVARWSATGACVLNTAVTGALEFTHRPGSGMALQTAWRQYHRHLWSAVSESPKPCDNAVKTQGRRL